MRMSVGLLPLLSEQISLKIKLYQSSASLAPAEVGTQVRHHPENSRASDLNSRLRGNERRILGSFHADAARLDGCRPFRDLGLDELAKILRRRMLVGNNRRAELFEAAPHTRHVHDLKDRAVEL